jgi:hypothetical protein
MMVHFRLSCTCEKHRALSGEKDRSTPPREFSCQALSVLIFVSCLRCNPVPVHAQDGGIDHLHRRVTTAAGVNMLWCQMPDASAQQLRPKFSVMGRQRAPEAVR